MNRSLHEGNTPHMQLKDSHNKYLPEMYMLA